MSPGQQAPGPARAGGWFDELVDWLERERERDELLMRLVLAGLEGSMSRSAVNSIVDRLEAEEARVGTCRWCSGPLVVKDPELVHHYVCAACGRLWLHHPDYRPPEAAIAGATPPARRSRPISPRRLEAYLAAVLEREARAVALTAVGQCGRRLFGAARRLGRLVAADPAGEEKVARILLVAAQTAGLAEGEARTTIAKGLERGRRRARSAAG